MKKLLLIASLLVAGLGVQESKAQCARSNFFYGEMVPNAGCGTFAPYTNYGPGEYFRIPVLNGASYSISTCGNTIDLQLTGYQGNNTTVGTHFFYNDDSGPICTGLQASATIVPTFTDYARVQVSQFNCQPGGTSSVTVNVRQNNNLNITSSAAAMCAGTTRALTATPAAVASAQPNSGNLGSFSGTGVSGTTFTAPTPAGASANYTITYTFGYCSTTQVITVFRAPSIANAGTDIEFCGTTATLAATAPVYGTGNWVVVSGPGSVTTPGSPTSGVTGLVQGSTTTLEWQVTNGPCTMSTDQVVLTGDATSPTAVCQNITTFLDGSGNSTITAADLDGGSTDNCGSVSLSASQTAFTCADLGPNSVTLTVDDGNSAPSNCVAIVTVVDSTSPTASCQNISVYLDGAGNASMVAADIDNGSTDNCTGVTLGASQTAFTCADIGTNNVTLTVTDGSSNTANCVAVVTVLDTVSPTAVCQNINAYLDLAGNVSITAADIDGGSSDNCGTPTLSASSSAFTCADLGPNNVTLTTTDGSANSNSCVAIVTVIDTVSPGVACQNITVQLDGTGNATIVAADIDNSSIDNCGTVSLTASTTSFTCADIGTNNVTLTGDDGNGNTANCVAVVTVNDTVSPVAVCQNISVYLDGAGNTTIVAGDIDGGSTDNCSTPTLTASTTSFTCADIGTNNVTLTVTDGSSNTSNCVAVVTVLDTVSPTAVCQNISIYLDGTGNATILDADIDGGSSDNCNSGTLTASLTSFTCAEIGANNVTLTADDGNGNSSNCVAVVTVLDTITPTISGCPSNIVTVANAAGCEAIVTWTAPTEADNCSGAILTSTNNSGDSFAIGTTTVTYTVTDGSGNSSSCGFDVTVSSDLVASIDSSMNITCAGDDNGIAYGSATGGDGNYSYDWDNDGFGDTDTSFADSLTVGTFAMSVMDGNGCVDTVTVSITAPDTLMVMLDSLTDPSGCTVADGNLYISVMGGTPGYVYDWDNDGTGDNDDTSDLANMVAGVYNLVVTDTNGCVANLTASLTDPNGPVISIDSITNLTCAEDTNGEVFASVTGGTPGYIYDWDNDGTGDNDDSTSIANLIAGTYVFTVTDTNGCIGIDSATVTAPDTLVLSLTSTDEILGSDGTIDLTVTGGTPSYVFDWDNDGTGDNDDTEDLFGLTAGNYVVVVTDSNGCTATTSIDVGSQIGILSHDSNMTMNLYPNPSDGNFTIDFNNVESSQLVINILDISGRVVYNNNVTGVNANHKEIIDISHVERGQYFIQVIDGEKSHTLKIVKQ